MKYYINQIFTLLCGFIFLFSCTCCSCNDNVVEEQDKDKLDFDDPSYVSIVEETIPNLVIKQHYVSEKEEIIKIQRGNETVALVKMGEPIVAAQADEVYEWGYFQFPKIYKVEDGNIMLKWQMKADSYLEYGSDSNGRLVSKDNGVTWGVAEKKYYHRDHAYCVLNNGNILQVFWPDSKDTKLYPDLPLPVNSEPVGGRFFYYESELPADLQGVFFECWNKQTGEVSVFRGQINDPELLRYSYSSDGLMPIFWDGTIKNNNDGSLIAGVYPANYLNYNGKVLCDGITFYKSVDLGNHWDKTGTITYRSDEDAVTYDGLEEGYEGYNEPVFEILKDGTLLCVMRTGFYTPMYKSFSKDGGYHWSKPEAFTSNGVSPNMILLDNGVLVLSSGRPGVQLRFNIDGDGDKWTEPIEMLPFMDENGQYADRIRLWPTCGYTSLMAVDDHTFYFVWSDFTRKNKEGMERKTIMFRKIEIIKR